MDFVQVQDLLMKLENAPSLAPRHAGAPQTIVITSKSIGPGGVRSDHKSSKSQKITFFSLFSHSPLEMGKMRIFMKFGEIWLKGGPWAVPGTDHCFSLGISRFLSLQNPENWPEIGYFMYFHEIS